MIGLLLVVVAVTINYNYLMTTNSLLLDYFYSESFAFFSRLGVAISENPTLPRV